MQYAYGHPWSMDHNHILEVMLILRLRWEIKVKSPRCSSNTTPGLAGFVSYPTVEGEISGNFNHSKGCQKANCQFALRL